MKNENAKNDKAQKIIFPKIPDEKQIIGSLYDTLESIQENLSIIADSLSVIGLLAEKYGLQNRYLSPEDIYRGEDIPGINDNEQ